MEQVDKRSKYTKTFLNTDGSLTTEAYTGAVHFKNEHDEWKEIDTSIVQRPDGSWGNKAGPFDARFPAVSGTELLDVTLNQTGISLSIPAGRGGISPVVDNNTIEYRDIYPNVDVRFVMDAESVEELFVLKQVPSGPTSFKVPLSLDGLTAATNSDGTISLQNASGKVLFTIPKLVMYDSSPEPAVKQLDVVVETSGNKAVLKISADAGWLSDPARIYPILIDPDLTMTSYQDAWIELGSQNTSADNAELRVGKTDKGNPSRALLKFANFGSANLRHVSSSYLKLFPSFYDSAQCAAATHSLHENTQAWSPLTVVWEGPDHDRLTALASQTVRCDFTGHVWSSTALTSLVQKWVMTEGFDTTYGVVVKSTSGETTRSYFRRYASRNFGDSTKRPLLSITYDEHTATSLSPSPGATVTTGKPQLSAGLAATTGHNEGLTFELYPATASPGLNQYLTTCPPDAIKCYTSATLTANSTTSRATWTAMQADGSFLPDGAYKWRVRSAGRFGPWSESSFTVAVPTPGPPRIIASPASPSNVTTPTWTFDGNGESNTTFTCSLTGPQSRAAEPCTSGTWPSAWPSLTADGSYTLSVKQSRELKTGSPTTSGPYVLDTVKPGVPTILTSPPSPGNDSTPTWSFGAGGETGTTLQCQLRKNGTVIFAWADCSSPHTYTITGSGTYSFELRQKDQAGNPSDTTTSTYVFDDIAPGAPSIKRAPASP
ncbi:MAG: DNRLRE domain-containing protein, partial [Actinomycetota bacterium]